MLIFVVIAACICKNSDDAVTAAPSQVSIECIFPCLLNYPFFHQSTISLHVHHYT